MSNIGGRIRPNQLDKAVFTIRKEFEIKDKDRTIIVRYNDKGQVGDVDLSDSQCAAILITTGQAKVYKVKVGRGGHYYNPLKVNASYGLGVPNKTSNEKMFDLKEVSEASFTIYIKFLQSRYDSYLMAAERI